MLAQHLLITGESGQRSSLEFASKPEFGGTACGTWMLAWQAREAISWAQISPSSVTSWVPQHWAPWCFGFYSL